MNALFYLLMVAGLSLCTAAAEQRRPNFVWIVSEDNSMHYLSHFFPGGAETPNIEALARQGLTFAHAFSNAPVCSVARSTLATMCLAPKLGTQYHRKAVAAALPEGQDTIYQAIRNAGYFTSNQHKTDFNFSSSAEPGLKQGVNWRARKNPQQPFFHMESHAITHEGRLHFTDDKRRLETTEHEPQAVALAACHPDTPLFRYTHARYLDRIREFDTKVGTLLGMLEADGLLEDTFVFYFSDHGGVLPRGKGYAYDAGLHVPLVVRIPKNFRHLVPDAVAASRRLGFVSFIDLGPTVLNLAGVEVPASVDGRPFLGPGTTLQEVEQRDTVFGYADRMDEKYDLVRTVRKGKYHYMRNFQPHYPDGLQNNYRYKMLAYREWRDLFDDDRLSDAQAAFFRERPVELLFDCDADPWNTMNLATDPAHHELLWELRALLSERLRSLPDLSFFPESLLAEQAMSAVPAEFGRQHAEAIGRYVAIADLALEPFDSVENALRTALESSDPMERYWAAMAAMAHRRADGVERLEPTLRGLLDDVSPVVRIRAGEFLGEIRSMDPQPVFVDVVNTTTNPVLALEALQAIVHFHDKADGEGRYPVAVASLEPVASSWEIEQRMAHLGGNALPRRNKQTGSEN
jgi:uncharacterized sulfatase